MIVIDASAMIELLTVGELAAEISDFLKEGDSSIHAPELLRAEVLQVLRRLENRSNKTRIAEAVNDFTLMPIEYYSHGPLLPRVWELRKNFTSYDAMYIALSEALNGILLTSDRALGKSKVHKAKVKFF